MHRVAQLMRAHRARFMCLGKGDDAHRGLSSMADDLSYALRAYRNWIGMKWLCFRLDRTLFHHQVPDTSKTLCLDGLICCNPHLYIQLLLLSFLSSSLACEVREAKPSHPFVSLACSQQQRLPSRQCCPARGLCQDYYVWVPVAIDAFHLHTATYTCP
jgi:hypothetical protein